MQTAVDYLLTKGISVEKFGCLCVFINDVDDDIVGNHLMCTFDEVEISRRDRIS